MKYGLSGVVCASITAIFLMSANNVSAAFINGDIAFGTAIGASWKPADNLLNTGTATTATADGIVFESGIDPSPIDEGIVTSAFGDFAAVTLGTFVDFNDFVFDPLVPGTQLWTFTSGGAYSFSMSTINVVSQTANSISLEGTGIASIDGFDDTGGDFTLTLNQSGEAFSFSSSASVVVPVPAAAWLFGSGVLGLVGIARHKKAA
jgi:hypothetical protein